MRSGAVVGYRTWRWSAQSPTSLLSAATGDHPWANDGPTVATCRSRRDVHRGLGAAQHSVTWLRDEVSVTVTAGDRAREAVAPAPASLRSAARLAIASRLVHRLIAELREEIAPTLTAPQMGCHCGLYAWYKLEDCHSYESTRTPTPSGAVLAWGRLVLHPEGFRAQYARVIALVRSAHPAAKALAETYGVPLVHRSVLESYATEFASVVPQEDRQPPPEPPVNPEFTPW